MAYSAFEAFLSTPVMQTVFGEASIFQAMMDFEAALARAQAHAGLMSQAGAAAIVGVCRAELYDLPAMSQQATRAGSLVVPMVQQLTQAVGLLDAEASRRVHWGATSQDVIDTAMALVTRRALGLIEQDLTALCGALLDLAEREVATPLLARTLMQPAQITSLAGRLLTWLAPLVRSAQALRNHAQRALALQLGGAVGTLAVMGCNADAVAQAMAEDLHLRLPLSSWHTQRDEWLRLGLEVGVLAGTLGKVARDWALMAQAEVGELSEPHEPGQGASSAMPNKRNPVAAMLGIAGAQRTPHRVAALLACMGQEQERGLGSWQAELAEWSALFVGVHGGLQAMAHAAKGLQLHRERMMANIDAQNGAVCAEALTFKLSEFLGKAAAQERVQQLCEATGAQHLRDLALQMLQTDQSLAGRMPASDIEALFDVQEIARAAGARCEPELRQLREQLTHLQLERHDARSTPG